MFSPRLKPPPMPPSFTVSSPPKKFPPAPKVIPQEPHSNTPFYFFPGEEILYAKESEARNNPAADLYGTAGAAARALLAAGGAGGPAAGPAGPIGPAAGPIGPMAAAAGAGAPYVFVPGGRYGGPGFRPPKYSQANKKEAANVYKATRRRNSAANRAAAAARAAVANADEAPTRRPEVVLPANHNKRKIVPYNPAPKPQASLRRSSGSRRSRSKSRRSRRS